jgi:anti-sigma regulatory factor (Ser/Thr protein kinase)
MDNNKLTIESAVLGDIPRIIEFVVSWLEQNGLDMYSFALETAVDEASTNVVKHAYGGAGGFFEIMCGLEGGAIVITIKDHGRKFDPSTVPLPDVDADLEHRKIGGLGIYMMRKMMDAVEYYYDEGVGNRLVMRKKKAA